jgi:hypothetical protein
MNIAYIHEPDADDTDGLLGPDPAPSGRLALALETFLARESRAQGPEGEWSEGLWFPSPNERRPCCEGLQPTPANKQALESHCRSAAHVAALYEVPVLDLRRALKRARVKEEAAPSQPAGSSARSMTNTERLARVSRAARSEAFAALRAEAERCAGVFGDLARLDESASAEEVAQLLEGAKSRLQAGNESLENAMQMELVFRVSGMAVERLRSLDE